MQKYQVTVTKPLWDAWGAMATAALEERGAKILGQVTGFKDITLLVACPEGVKIPQLSGVIIKALPKGTKSSSVG
jgi:hypothetical protein